MKDVVVDTNVLAHAGNPQEPRFGDSFSFLAELLASDTKLCVDKDVARADDEGTDSFVWREYQEHLTPSSPGFAILVKLLQTKRCAVVKTNVPRPVRQWAIARVSKPRDRKFFFLAANSRERVLVSHDYNDFTNDNRAQAKRRFKVRICDAEGARSLL